MRRLMWLAVGLGLAWYGFSLIPAGENLAAYRLRDGLIVATLGALIFVGQLGRPRPSVAAAGRRQWPMVGRTMLITAVACAAAAAALLTVLGTQGWPALMAGSLWGVGALLFCLGLFWPGRLEIYPAPAYRWRVDAAGRWVRLALGEDEDAVPVWGEEKRWLYRLLLLLALGLGAWLRLRQLMTQPPTCLEQECALALRLVEDRGEQGLTAAGLGLYELIAQGFWYFLEDGLSAVRWASALLGLLALPAWYWAARAYLRPVGALLGLFVLALLPWAVWTSRLGSDWSVTPLLVALILGAGQRALTYRTHRWWGLAGVAAGLLLAQPLGWGMHAAVLAWLLATACVAWNQAGRSGQALGEQAAVLVGAALVVGLPLALPVLGTGLAAAREAVEHDARLLLAGLLHSKGAGLAYFSERPLLPPFWAGAVWIGIGVGLRRVLRPTEQFWLAGLLFLGGVLLWLPPPAAPAHLWLTCLSLFLLGAALTLDALWETFARAWRPLLPPMRALAVAAVLLVVLLGREAFTLTQELDFAGATAQNQAEIAMGQYLARCLRGEAGDDPCSRTGEEAPIFYVPPPVVESPSAQLLIGAAVREGRVRPFYPEQDILPDRTPAGALYYLVAFNNRPLIDLLRQFYPDASLRPEPQGEAGGSQFLVLAISRDDVLAHQGVQGAYYPGEETGRLEEADASTPAVTRQDGPLAFGWAGNPPLEAPFNVVWEGSLLLPAAGSYTFSVQGNSVQGNGLPDGGLSDDFPDDDPQSDSLQSGDLQDAEPRNGDPVISLLLDGEVVLDTSLGVTTQQKSLPRGYVDLTLRYRTASPPGDWAVIWTPPDGEPAPIPRAKLYHPPLPDIGSLGSYYAGEQWEGSPLSVRRDLLLGAAVDLPMPYSVRWTGKIAAPRAGEYLFSVAANGPTILSIDGMNVLRHAPPDNLDELASEPGYTQSGIYLERGWHEFELRYAPQGRSDLQVLWQPPGGQPAPLLSRYLLPDQTAVTAADSPLPALPELLDARLGTDEFALTANLEPVLPAASIPPQTLPTLLAESVWSAANGCGAAQDQFDSPRGVALSSDGRRVYVADANNQRVAVLDLESGALLDTLDHPDFQEPVDVAMDVNGTLLVLDAVAQAIFRFDRSTGEASTLSQDTGFYRPRGLSVHPNGQIAVADTGGGRVVLLDNAGDLLTQYGGPQTMLGRGQPVDSVFAGGQLWAVTAEDGRIWRLDLMGSLTAIARANTVTGPHLAALADGAFFLSDPARRTLLYFAPSGRPLAQLAYTDMFSTPTGVAAQRQDELVQLVVADSATCSVGLWRLRVAVP